MKKIKHKSMEFLISYGPAFLIIVGTIFTTILTKNYRKQIKDRQEKIIDLTDEVKDKSDYNQNLNERILGLSEEIKIVSQDNQELTKKNLILSEETIKLSNKISNQQTGKDSYCYLDGKFIGNHESLSEIVVFHEGEYTVRNVQIQLVDQYRRNILYKNNRKEIDGLGKILSSKSNSKKEKKIADDKMMDLIESMNNATLKVYIIGDVAPNTLKILDKVLLEKGQNEIYWLVTIMADNGSYRQSLKILDVYGKYTKAWQVKDSKGNLLKERVSNDFPRNEDGTVKWNNE